MKWKLPLAGAILILLSLAVLWHHHAVSGRWFDLSDILHHEFVGSILFLFGVIALLISGLKVRFPNFF